LARTVRRGTIPAMHVLSRQYDKVIADYIEAIRLNPIAGPAFYHGSEATDDWIQPFVSLLA
jgi:hypothetical protein